VVKRTCFFTVLPWYFQMEEEDHEEYPSEGKEEQLEEEGPKEDPTEERIGLTKDENLVRRPIGLEDEGVDSEEKRGEFVTGVTSWSRGKCGWMCRGQCPLDVPASGV